MIDLTLNEKDRDNFITKLYLKNGTNQFIVKYASGRVEEQDFSVHNFNVVLYKMEEQFLEYRDTYIKKLVKFHGQVHFKKLIQAIIAILGVYLTINMDMSSIIQTLLVILLAGFTFLYQVSYSKVSNLCENNIYTVFVADRFLQIKDKFKIQVSDPKTGMLEDWYLISLSNVDDLFGLANLELLGEGLRDENVRNEQIERTEEMFQQVLSM